MKHNKDFWNGYIAHMLAEQFSFWDGQHKWSLKIDKILRHYHAEIIQIPENFEEYSAPLHALIQEAKSKINDSLILHSIDRIVIYWCEHMLHVLKLGKEIAILVKNKFEDGLIGYENGIRQIEQEINFAKEYILIMGKVNKQLI